jgi:hypothetical protein
MRAPCNGIQLNCSSKNIYPAVAIQRRDEVREGRVPSIVEDEVAKTRAPSREAVKVRFHPSALLEY